MGCTEFSNLASLAKLKKLESLTLSDWRCPLETKLTFLSQMSSLTYLDMSRTWQLTDLTPLSGLTGLTTLKLRSCRRIADLTP